MLYFATVVITLTQSTCRSDDAIYRQPETVDRITDLTEVRVEYIDGDEVDSPVEPHPRSDDHTSLWMPRDGRWSCLVRFRSLESDVD